jgi:hypothetical protein
MNGVHQPRKKAPARKESQQLCAKRQKSIRVEPQALSGESIVTTQFPAL